MLYDANFRLNENEPRLKVLDFDVVELIRKNERGELDSMWKGNHRLVPIILRTVKKTMGLGKTIMALPFGGDCFYCLTDPENKKCASGGFVFEKDALYFAEKLINLEHDRDGYRQQPTIMYGNYATDLSFKQIIEFFQQKKIPLFRTIADEGVYYDKKSWPKEQIPNLGKISYEEAFEKLSL